MTEWDDGKTLNLIEMYRDKPIIWNPKNKDFYKQHLKLDAWEEIDAAMSIPGEECKRKMLSVLSAWRREKAKEKKSVGTGKGRDYVYESRWFAYRALQFLMDRDEPRKGLTTKDRTNNEADYSNENTEASTSHAVEPSPKKLKPDPKLQMMKEAFGILKTAAEQPRPTEHLKDENPEEIMQVIFRTDQRNYGYGHSYGGLPQTTYGFQQASTSTAALPVLTDVPVVTSHSSRSYVYPQPATTPILTSLPPVIHSLVDSHSPSYASPSTSFTSTSPVPPPPDNSNSPSLASPSPLSVYSDMDDFI